MNQQFLSELRVLLSRYPEIESVSVKSTTEIKNVGPMVGVQTPVPSPAPYFLPGSIGSVGTTGSVPLGGGSAEDVVASAASILATANRIGMNRGTTETNKILN